MSSTDVDPTGFASFRIPLLQTARQSIRHGLSQGEALQPAPESVPPPLCAYGACFVTLHLDRELRGCIGSLEPYRPLIDDVAGNAYGAAFRDPRFAPLTEAEFARIDLHISILHPAQPLRFESEADLLRQLQPDVDGLILEAGALRGTFLPSVWEALPEPAQFLRELKRKAGLPVDYWSDAIRVWRYATESIADDP